MLLRQRGQQGRRQPGHARGRRQHGGAADRVALVRHGGRTALARAGRLGNLAHLGLHHQREVARQVAERAGQQRQRGADVGHAVLLAVPRCRGQRQIERLRQRLRHGPAVRAEARQRAGRAAELQRGHVRAQRGEAVLRAVHRRQPAGGLAAEGGRQRLLQPGARDHRRRAMRAGQRGERIGQLPQIGIEQRGRLPPLQHQAGVDDVLAGRAPMHVARGVLVVPCDGGRQLLDQRNGEIARAGRRRAERVQIRRRRGAHRADRRDGLRRDHAGLAFGLRQRGLHVEHRAHGGRIGPHRQHGRCGEGAIEQSGGHRGRTHTRSITSAMPWPTPMHIVHSA